MAGVLGKVGGAVGSIIGGVKDAWKKMPKEQRTEALTAMGIAAAAAFAKPKAEVVVPDVAPLRVGAPPMPSGGDGPRILPFTAPPQPIDASESKFAKKMRRNFGR